MIQKHVPILKKSDISNEWCFVCDPNYYEAKYELIPEQAPRWNLYTSWQEIYLHQKGYWLYRSVIFYDLKCKNNLQETYLNLESLYTWQTYSNWQELSQDNDGRWFKKSTVFFDQEE